MENVKVKYDEPIEVSKKIYDLAMNELGQIVAGMEKDGKYYIKCWHMGYKKYVKKLLLTGKI